MNICFIVDGIPNLRVGGVENVTFRIAKGLQDRGHKIKLITIESPSKDDVIPFDHMSISIDDSNFEKVYQWLKSGNIQIVINQGVAGKLHEVVSAIKERLVNVGYIKTLHVDPLNAWKTTIDFGPLYTESNIWEQVWNKISPLQFCLRTARKHRRIEYLRGLYSSWIECYDKIILLSDSFKSDFLDLCGGVQQEKIEGIPNPIDTLLALDDKFPKKKQVLFVGRLVRTAKRPDRIMAVWRRLFKLYPDWQLIIIGDGPLKEGMEVYCKRNKITNVVFTGVVDPTPYYRTASVLCVTSTCEGFGMVISEALSFKVIPMAFNSYKSLRDLIVDKVTGVMVRPYSIRNYSLELEKLLRSAESREQYRRNILIHRPSLSKFSMDNVLNRWELLFTNLLNNKHCY